MGSSQLRLSSHSHFCAIGDVEIHPSVAIAPGAVLAAAPGSRISLAEGVCIGAGSVLQVDQGTLELAMGASLGNGVLIVGSGRVGVHACIGAEATVLNPAIADGAAIAAKSLIGDGSRQMAVTSVDVDPATATAKVDQNGDAAPVEAASEAANAQSEASAETNGSGKLAQFSQVYGKEQVNQLLSTLFPHRRPLN
ncbi:MAG: hypothetical protein ACTS3T_22140 [Almyronema sp.]